MGDRLEPWERPWIRDFRGTNRSRPNDVDRGLAPAPARTSPAAMARPGLTSAPAPTPTQRATPPPANDGLSPAQRREWLQSVKRAAQLLPKAKREWNGFLNALHAGKPLPAKVTRALQENFGWTNTESNNNALPFVPEVIDQLALELNPSLPVKNAPGRAESSNSTPQKRRFIRAQPLQDDKGQSRGLLLFPDFFTGSADGRARTVIHEIVHTWDGRAGHPLNMDWHDAPFFEGPKPVGNVRKFTQDPGSYAGLIHDLGR